MASFGLKWMAIIRNPGGNANRLKFSGQSFPFSANFSLLFFRIRKTLKLFFSMSGISMADNSVSDAMKTAIYTCCGTKSVFYSANSVKYFPVQWENI